MGALGSSVGEEFIPGQIVAFDGPVDRITTSSTFETELTINMPGDTPAGRYIIEARALVSIDATNADYHARLQRNGVQITHTFRREGKDASGVGLAADGNNSGTDQRVSMVLSKTVTLPENSTDVITYQHLATISDVEASCFDLNMRVIYIGPDL